MYKSLASRPGLQPHAVPSATVPLSAPVCVALLGGSQTQQQHRLLLQPAQAVKAVDLDAVSSKDLLYQCSTWWEVGSLVAESQDKLTRDKSYGVRVAMRLADIIMGNVVDLDDLVSLNGISEAEKMGSAARTASKSGTVKPSSAKPLKGVERQRALKLLDSVLLMTLGNLDK
ncbi:hypothetical protein DUNSADRAFT_7212 [Dunaliella salina]|uniref:Uncharacterized protein n=1 Tax=Dunaliella salina TaxID=3046 RepID=A0ABQ7GLT0_DUNSA|nr:hypothetical protein DUNSADRAFT_7212 [Dunaliella salina]|eukprot:KAF5835559.1 hypothetical protein DUNSADRAFT_7212 [Dunaliella salina]